MVSVFGNFSNAQDFHYSQFFNSPLHLNPGLTGIYNPYDLVNFVKFPEYLISLEPLNVGSTMSLGA